MGLDMVQMAKISKKDALFLEFNSIDNSQNFCKTLIKYLTMKT